MADEFKWHGPEQEADVIVFGTVSGVAVYKNGNGDITIRQERNWDEDQDSTVVIPVGQIKSLIAAIRRAVKE